MTVRADLREAWSKWLRDVIVAIVVVILAGKLCAELVRIVALIFPALGTVGVGIGDINPLRPLFLFVADLIETVALVVAVVYGVSVAQTAE